MWTPFQVFGKCSVVLPGCGYLSEALDEHLNDRKMLNKRRRASSVASRQDEELGDDSTPEQSPVLSTRKRRRLDPTELCQHLYDSIRNIKKEDGTMLCDTFIRAPKRRQEPSYYEVVANPIDLLRVQQKLKTDSYDDIEELTTDLELLVKNAKAFYKPDSTEYHDACLLWETFNINKIKLLESLEEEPRLKRIGRQQRRSTANESETSESSGKQDEDFDPYEELFAAVMTAIDPLQENRPLHREFQLLPSRKIYPDYYDVIEHPIDLRLIATKIQTNAYSNIGEMEKDLLQMTRNACMFNEPGSQIYKDAKTLKKIFTAKRIEIETGKAKTTIFKRRGPTLSAITAALKEELESSDDDSDSNERKCGEGPMWQLFDHLFNSASASDPPNATGAPLGQSLWKLPYRRFHPEYYDTVRKPISMAQIQKKLKKGDYANISDLTADLYLMLDNAKRAFPPNHKTHKDAVKMLKIMNAKLVDVGVEQDIKIESNDTLGVLEDSLDGGPPSVNSDIVATSSPAPSIASTPVSTKGKPTKPKTKVVTGYILYSSDVRKGISQSNPDATFGDISRMVGNEWKNLPASVKQAWEDKATRMNEENAKHSNESNDQQHTNSASNPSNPSPVPASNEPPATQQIYECLWDNCDYQFEDPIDCMEHCIQESKGHVQKTYANKPTDVEYQCLWKGCVRLKKNMTPFPHLQRLIKHVREVHLNKGGKCIPLENKSKNFVARKNPTPQTQTSTSQTASTSTPSQQSSPLQPPTPNTTSASTVPGPPEPMFVTVPPRPQRVLHSEAYIKYIEGLQNDTRHITPWEKTLKATQKTTPPVDISKLPTQWLGKTAADKPEEVVNALWHLRNFMMKDVLEIRRNYS